MITLLESLLTKEVSLLVSGHYINGTLTSLDLVKRLAYFTTEKEQWIIAIDHIGMVKI